MEHIKTIYTGNAESSEVGQGCGECQASCQSACKTSCTVGNQRCERSEG
ncbi:MAG: six-cysteine ranthipeptide SCIFF [Turicibacter sp.]|nr:six-cysteine ranthipeptide SCIFF [Turicibacter sp.]